MKPLSEGVGTAIYTGFVRGAPTTMREVSLLSHSYEKWRSSKKHLLKAHRDAATIRAQTEGKGNSTTQVEYLVGYKHPTVWKLVSVFQKEDMEDRKIRLHDTRSAAHKACAHLHTALQREATVSS